MATPVIVPIAAHITFDDLTALFRLAADVLSELSGDTVENTPAGIVLKLADLATLLAHLLNFFSTGTGMAGVKAGFDLGDLHALADYIKANYPAGYIVALARPAGNLPGPHVP